MSSNEIYASMIQPRGAAYRQEQITPYSYYNDPIDHSSGRLAGNSHIAGDATPEVQSGVVDSIISASERAGLNPHQTAYVLAIARHESGFNPDAAAGTTSAYGLGQFVSDTGAGYGINDGNRGDLAKQAEALVAHYKDNAVLAASRGQGDAYIYKYHHDGPSRDYGGLDISEKHVMPYVARYESFVRERERAHGTELIDPTFDKRNHAAPTHTRLHHAQHSHHNKEILVQGSNGTAVNKLQSELGQLGYTDNKGHLLKADGHFGADTHHAVVQFQADHGLLKDGKVGHDTQAALQAALQAKAEPNLDDKRHPDHTLYAQALAGVHQVEAERGIKPGAYSENLAAALVVAAKSSPEGLQRIDRVVLSDDGQRAFAVEIGSMRGINDKHAFVETQTAANTPMTQSSAAAAVIANPVTAPAAPAPHESSPQRQTSNALSMQA